jgi:hypothetical protein
MSILSTSKQDLAVGNRLLAVREAFALTQSDMAGRLGITSRAKVSFPEGWVASAGGHIDVSAALGGDRANHADFAAKCPDS